MQTVNFIPRSTPNTLTFVLKSHKAAEDLYKKGLDAMKSDSIIEVEDDFDTKAIIRMIDIASVSFSEYEKDMDRNGDLKIIQAKAELKTNNKAKNDIGLQMLSNQAQGGIKQ